MSATVGMFAEKNESFWPDSIFVRRCRCHRPGQPGHGPHLRLTHKVDAKTFSESLPTLAAARKAEREVAEFHNFQQLSRAFVETNTKICHLRPVDEELETDQEKKRPKRSVKRSPAK
jgi:hypothetical protein